MELTPDELVSEFRDAVTELYFARKRIALLESENAALRARLAEAATGSGRTRPPERGRVRRARGRRTRAPGGPPYRGAGGAPPLL
ncbi:hypothetical protein ACFQ60_18055 [Streptomyces zhihengii]